MIVSAITETEPDGIRDNELHQWNLCGIHLQ